MRYVLNGRFFTQPVTGVQRYARSLTAAGLGVPEEMVRVALPGSGLVPLADAATTTIPSNVRQGHFWEQVMLPRLLAPDDLLVGLCNYGPRRLRRQVLTLHDAASAIVPETFSRLHHALFTAFGVGAARAARLVVTHSETSKMGIIDSYGIKPDRVHVVPCGVAPMFTPGPAIEDGPGYCLFVGAHDPRKNLAFLEALWPEVERRTGLRLVATGRSVSRAHAAAGGAGVADVRTDVEDAELVALYRGATLVLQPSRYEGFGLPALEGAACGTPFLSTDVGAAWELAARPDDQVLPLVPEAWVEAIVRIAEMSAADRAAFETESLAVAGRFTWEHSAARLGEVLRAAAGEMS